MLPRVVSLLTVLFYAALGASLQGMPTNAAESDEARKRMRCMACHAGTNQNVLDGKPRQSRSQTINLPDFHDADHGKTQCLDCHTKGFDIFPHRSKKTETCMDCHPRKEKGAEDDRPYDFHRIADEFEKTAHFTGYRHAKEKCCGTSTGKPAARESVAASEEEKKANERFTCEHCHEPHYFKATKRIKEPELILRNDNGPCLHCHMDGASVALKDPAKPSLLAAHLYLPYAELHLQGTRCVDCHTSVKTTVAHDLPEGMKANQGCNTCHSIDSVLVSRLYRYAGEQGSALGFHNARVLQNGYVMGANRHRWTDLAAYLLMSFGLILVFSHAGLRIAARRQRSRAGEASS